MPNDIKRDSFNLYIEAMIDTVHSCLWQSNPITLMLRRSPVCYITDLNQTIINDL